MDYFRNHLYLNGKVPSSQVPHYVRWISRCYEFCGKTEGAPLGDHQVDAFLAQISTTQSEDQRKQAISAISEYRYLYHHVQSDADGHTANFENQWQDLLVRFRQAARLMNLSESTTIAYAQWVKSFLEFWRGVQPIDLSDVHALLYLSHLSGERDLPGAMRSQTASALCLFFRYVIQCDASCFENWTPEADRLTRQQKVS